MHRLDEVLKNKTLFFIVGILFLSLSLRLYHINYQSLWLDELYSIVPTDPQSSLSAIIDYCKGDQPPLFFLYIHYVFKLTVYDEVVGRLACAFIGLLGVVAMYFLGKECYGKTAGLFASYVTGINYFHIDYSQELRFYGMAFLFSALSYFFFIRVIKNRRPVDLFGYIISVICLLYTHYYGLFIFGAQGLSFLFVAFYKKDLKLFYLSLVAGIVVTIAFIPWMSVIMNDLGVDLGWIKAPDAEFVAQYFYYYTGKDAIATLIFLFLIYLFAKPLVKGSAAFEEKVIAYILIIWIVLTYLVPYLRGILFSPMLSDRYTIITLPAWILVFTIGWDKIKNQRLKYVLPIVLLLGFAINMLFFRKHYTRIEKSQFREASELVLRENKSHYPIYSSLDWHFNFYFRNTGDKVRSLTQVGRENIETFWLLQAHFEPEEMEAEIKNLSSDFKITEVHPFHYANAILMTRKVEPGH